ncbi:GntR family transcriptional regulator [Microbacterium caowuchunii]|uniref:GntR family transcriptional regulator n=1 Tax=Microbacterium caowuchunii TaxID=2614638 RepID=A0A5N0THN7_9MICO|nr:GntR family transcriptional regulator [Microbacterium caowuchunii]KAA9133617.1 GntR family transcriptional regulator [Microbacterium caowuchunii]
MTAARQPEHGEATAHIAGLLREAIVRGDFTPGARVRQEQIAELTGASRAPVREALRMLAAEGLVTLVANSGARVSSLSLPECQEIYRVRERVEPLLLRMSAPGLDESELDHLGALAEEMAETADPEEFLALDRAFHLATYAAAETVVLSDLVHRLWNRTQAYRRIYTALMDERARQTVHDEHRLIVAAIRDGDLDSAESLLAGHIRRTRRQLASHPEVFATHPTTSNASAARRPA